MLEDMKKYIKYLWYIVRHKYFVMVECWARGLFWRGVSHDFSKLLPSEFVPYANYFYGGGNKSMNSGRDSTKHRLYCLNTKVIGLIACIAKPFC